MGQLIKKNELPETPLSLSLGNRRLYNTLIEQAAKTQFMADVKSGLIEVALKMAEEIVGDAVKSTPAMLEQKYQHALSQVSALAPGSIRIHPKGEAHTTIRDAALRAGFVLVLDDTLHPADCVVETADVKVDATVETALYHFKKCFTADWDNS